MYVGRFATWALLAAGLMNAVEATSAQTTFALAPSPQPGDSFGEEITLASKTIIFIAGSANWDSAFETPMEAFRKIHGILDQHGIRPTGPPMTIYTATDDAGFEYQAAIPIAASPKGPLPEHVAVGNSPEGRALKFVHRGSYDAMDSTYEAIANHLDAKRLEARDLFIENYVTDPIATPNDNLIVEVYVPLK